MSAEIPAASAQVLHIKPSRVYVPPQDAHRLAIHLGPTVKADCHCDGKRHRRVQREGDFDIIPAGLDGSWEDDRACTILRVVLPDNLVRRTARDLGIENYELLPHFQRRDPAILSIAQVMRSEIETSSTPNQHYIDALGRAVAIRLVTFHGAEKKDVTRHRSLSSRQRNFLSEYIEEQLAAPMSLTQMAGLVGMSLSTFKLAFRQGFGMAPYQYLLSRRVERARVLVSSSSLTFAEIAIEAGFAHQSHMTNSLKRHLGYPPGAIIREHA